MVGKRIVKCLRDYSLTINAPRHPALRQVHMPAIVLAIVVVEAGKLIAEVEIGAFPRIVVEEQRDHGAHGCTLRFQM